MHLTSKPYSFRYFHIFGLCLCLFSTNVTSSPSLIIPTKQNKTLITFQASVFFFKKQVLIFQKDNETVSTLNIRCDEETEKLLLECEASS